MPRPRGTLKHESNHQRVWAKASTGAYGFHGFGFEKEINNLTGKGEDMNQTPEWCEGTTHLRVGHGLAA